MITTREDSGDLIGNYMAKVKIGLKRIDEGQQQEILAEIQSHLTDRIEQLKHQGSIRPVEDALAAMGVPDELSLQFVEESVARASSSLFPWVLLRAAWRLVFTGLRGTLVFLAGLIGYVSAICFVAATVAKLILPAKVGFWVGPHTTIIWGYAANAPGARELAGQSFVYVSIALAFLCASGTTMLLKYLLRSSKSTKARFPG